MPKGTRSVLVVVLVRRLFASAWSGRGCDSAEVCTAVLGYGVPEGLEPLPLRHG